MLFWLESPMASLGALVEDDVEHVRLQIGSNPAANT